MPEGARWLVLVEPRRAFENAGLRRLFDILLPPRRMDAWIARYAVDPRQVERAALAGYLDGTLLIASGDLEASRVVKAAAEVMDAVETQDTTPTPRVVGLIGTSRYLLAAADEQTVLLGEDAPEQWSAVLAFVDQRRDELPPPAIAQAIQRARTEARNAPLVLHVLAPLGLPLDSPIGVVLAEQQQLSITVSSLDPSNIDVWVALTGAFPSSIEDNLRAFLQSLAQEPLGTALGIADALGSLRIERAENTVVVQASFPTERVSRGLEMLFGADLMQLIDGAQVVETK